MNVEDSCFLKAQYMISNGLAKDMDLFDLTDLLINIEKEKEEKQLKNDAAFIDFNDEIVSIEEVGELETVDISVTGDQLFYCNEILTKNSMGITHTADCILGLITTEELDGLGQLMIKQLKNRWGDISFYRRFVVGIDRSKMQIFELEENAQRGVTGNSAANTASFSNSSLAPAFGQGSKKTLFSAGGIS